MSKKYKISFLVVIIILIALFFVGFSKTYEAAKNLIPWETKELIKNRIFTKNFKEKEMLSLQGTIDRKQHIIDQVRDSLSLNKKLILLNQKKLTSENNESYQITNYYIPFKEYFENGQNPPAYLDEFNNKIFIISAIGEIIFFDKKNINEETKFFDFIRIPTNINEVIIDDKFYDLSENSHLDDKYLHASFPIGVKDILINDGNIYISYTKKVSEACYNTSIISGKIDYKKIIFSEFFTYDDCVAPQKHFNYTAHQSGGRILNLDRDNILFSIGEFRDRPLAQDISNPFGKIIKINKINKKYEILSLGHRNVQGLAFDSDVKFILSSEHGPKGGDEINIQKDFNITNFGWPISSYGLHYDGTEKEYAPLFKSHSDHGFKEPFKYYVPSIGISEIEIISSNFFNENISNDDKNIFVTSLANRSIRYIKADKNYNKILKEDLIFMGERIRDILYDKDNNLVYLIQETIPTFSILKKID